MGITNSIGPVSIKNFRGRIRLRWKYQSKRYSLNLAPYNIQNLPHTRKLAKIFEDIANGVKKRVIVNIAPRHGKSEMISYLAPAWFLGKYPQESTNKRYY